MIIDIHKLLGGYSSLSDIVYCSNEEVSTCTDAFYHYEYSRFKEYLGLLLIDPGNISEAYFRCTVPRPA